MANNAIRVEGLSDLIRAFNAADKTLRQDLGDALQEAAAPVRETAQQLAVSEISGMRRQKTSQWHMMRVGLERGGRIAYVAPLERGVKTRGRARYRRGWNTGPPSFPSRIKSEAMEPALARNRTRVLRRIDQMLAEVKAIWERYG